MSEAEQQEQTPDVIGPGSLLKEAREKAGLSVEQIAQKLHLKNTSIENIEIDKYDDNISLTFTKGYLKLYAKHVGLAEHEVLEAFEKLNTQKPKSQQNFKVSLGGLPGRQMMTD